MEGRPKSEKSANQKTYTYCKQHIILMEEHLYPFIDLVGSSPISWEKAAENAIKEACKSVWCFRIAEVKELDAKLDDQGRIIAYRAKLRVSFKYDDWKSELGWKSCKG
jgi:hypothetical protein